jgi:hypothetical protein
LNNSNRFEFDFELNLTVPRNCSRGPVVCALASPISHDSVPPPARAGSEPVLAASHRPLPLLPHCTNKRRYHRRRAPFRSIPCSRPSSSETEPPLTTLASYPLRSSASSPPHQESRPPPLLLPSLGELRHAPPSSVSSGPHLTPSLVRFLELQDIITAAEATPTTPRSRPVVGVRTSSPHPAWPPPRGAPVVVVMTSSIGRALASRVGRATLRGHDAGTTCGAVPAVMGQPGRCATGPGRRPEAGPQCGPALCTRSFKFLFSFIISEIHINF